MDQRTKRTTKGTKVNCLHCGDCCLRMSPLSAPEPCPYIKQVDNFYFCSCYEKRPEECVNHTFHSRVCPIGMDILNLQEPEEMRQRLDAGYALTKYPELPLKEAINQLYRN